jgi:hypothetical protein
MSKGFAPIPDVVQQLADEAARRSNVPTSTEVAAEPVHPAVEAADTFKFPEKAATQTMSFKVPKDLYEDLRAFKKKTDIDMSVIMVEGARKELVAMKKRYGIV